MVNWIKMHDKDPRDLSFKTHGSEVRKLEFFMTHFISFHWSDLVTHDHQ